MKRNKTTYLVLFSVLFGFAKIECMEEPFQSTMSSVHDMMKISFVLNQENEEIDSEKINTDVTKQPICKKCHKVFSNFTNLRRHKRNVHKREKRFSWNMKVVEKNIVNYRI